MVTRLARSLGIYPRHDGLESWCTVINLAEHILISLRILTYRSSIPLATAIDARKGALQMVLESHLMLAGIAGVGMLHGTLH